MRGRSALFGHVGATLASYASARVITPLAALVGLALLLSIAAIQIGGERQDLLQRRGEANAIEFSLRQLGRALEAEVRDYSWWDDAVRHLVLAPDPVWADANVGPYIHSSFGYEVSAVLASDGRPVYGHVEGRRDMAGALAVLGPRLAGLVARAAEHDQGHEPRPVRSVLSGPEGLFVVAASPIVPMAGSALQLPADAPSVLVFGKRLDAAFLRGLEQDLGIRNPSYAQSCARSWPGLATVAKLGRRHACLPFVDTRAARSGAGRADAPGNVRLAAVLRGRRATGGRARPGRPGDRRERGRFRDISQAASDWIWETDTALRLTFVSEACQRSLCLDPASLIGRPLPSLLVPLDGTPAPEQDIAALAAKGPFHSAVFRCEAHGGEHRVLRVAGKAVVEDGRTVGYRGIATDITAEVAALEQARFLAHHDALTGLPNRVLMHERLREIVARSRRHGTGAAVLCLDLDGFKEVNDTLGHSSGDVLLARCAERLRGCLRSGDTVARQGGDEFTVLQSDVDNPSEVEGLCRRIVGVLAEPFDLEGRKAHVTASIGVAVVPGRWA